LGAASRTAFKTHASGRTLASSRASPKSSGLPLKGVLRARTRGRRRPRRRANAGPLRQLRRLGPLDRARGSGGGTPCSPAFAPATPPPRSLPAREAREFPPAWCSLKVAIGGEGFSALPPRTSCSRLRDRRWGKSWSSSRCPRCLRRPTAAHFPPRPHPQRCPRGRGHRARCRRRRILNCRGRAARHAAERRHDVEDASGLAEALEAKKPPSGSETKSARRASAVRCCLRRICSICRMNSSSVARRTTPARGGANGGAGLDFGRPQPSALPPVRRGPDGSITIPGAAVRAPRDRRANLDGR
jgi:hypothetical protein